MDDDEEFELGEDPEFIASGEDRCWGCGLAHSDATYCEICWLRHPATDPEAILAYWDLVIDEIFVWANNKGRNENGAS